MNKTALAVVGGAVALLLLFRKSALPTTAPMGGVALASTTSDIGSASGILTGITTGASSLLSGVEAFTNYGTYDDTNDSSTDMTALNQPITVSTSSDYGIGSTLDTSTLDGFSSDADFSDLD